MKPPRLPFYFILKSIIIILSGYKSDPFLSFFWSRESPVEFLTPSRMFHKDKQYSPELWLPGRSTCSSCWKFSPGFVRSKSDSNWQFPGEKHSGDYPGVWLEINVCQSESFPAGSHCCSWTRRPEPRRHQPRAGSRLVRTSCRRQCRGPAGSLCHLVRNIQHGMLAEKNITRTVSLCGFLRKIKLFIVCWKYFLIMLKWAFSASSCSWNRQSLDISSPSCPRISRCFLQSACEEVLRSISFSLGSLLQRNPW